MSSGIPFHSGLYDVKLTFRAWTGIAEGMGVCLVCLLIIEVQGARGEAIRRRSARGALDQIRSKHMATTVGRTPNSKGERLNFSRRI